MLGFTKFKINRLVNRRELYSNFSYNKWNQLDTGSKWKCLQQLENHFAAEQGRPAVKVLPISSKEVRGDYGGYDPDKNVIYINRDLVEYGTLVGPVDINHPTQLDANMQLFDTIAHEGYHAYQGYAIKHPGFHKDMKQVKEWAINDRNVKYFRRGDEYLVQPRERDAWKYGSEKTREAFDEIEKYYGTEPGRAMYEKSVEDNSYENALERLWNNNPDALNQMYKEMMDAYEERYWENNSTVNLDPITVDEYDAISREAVNRYYEHLKNNPSLSNEDVMRMTGDMSEKYFSAVEEYKNAVQQKEKSEDRGEKENRTEKYEAQNPENRSIFNPDRVSVEEYDKTLRDQVNKYYEHLKNDPSLSNEDVMQSYIYDEKSGQTLGVMAELQQMMREIFIGNFQKKGGLSMRKLVRRKGGRVIFVEYDLGIGGMLMPIYRLLIDLAIKEALCRTSNEGNVYFFIDEFRLVPHLEHIDDGVNFGRSLGAKFFVGIQNIDQVMAAYGEYTGRSILSGFGTTFAFRVNDVGSREYIKNLFGRNIKQQSYMSKVQNRGIAEQLREGYVVEDDDINNLPVGEAIVSAPSGEPFRFKFNLYQ